MKQSRIQKQNICNAGEYYIASRLSAEDFVATITLGRAEQYDILAASPNGKVFKISVKTRLKEDIKFNVNKKCENIYSQNLFYALVLLNEFKKEPDFWIIPSKRMSEILKKAQQKWVAEKPNKRNSEHSIRDFYVKFTERTRAKKYYPQNWEKELKKYYKNIEQLK